MSGIKQYSGRSMKKKKNIIIIICSAVLLCAAVFAVLVLTGVLNSGGKTFKELNITDDLVITDLSFYSGDFVEDGSNEKVENIASVKLKNTGKKDYEYVEFDVITKKNSYHFKASTVFGGSVTTVLNSEKKTLAKNDGFKSSNVKYCTEYIKPPSLLEDVFTLHPYPNTINISNESGKDIPGKVYVYYKEKDENGYFGGITYRAVFDGIKNGEVKQRVSYHFDEVVNITYEE